MKICIINRFIITTIIIFSVIGINNVIDLSYNKHVCEKKKKSEDRS